ncbi:hypothetical protein OROGR_026091 [Orobanche gracilis]
MASVWTVHVNTASSLPISRPTNIFGLSSTNLSRRVSNELQFQSFSGIGCHCTNWNRRITYKRLVVKAVSSIDDRRLLNDAAVIGKLKKDSAEKPHQNLVAKLQESVGCLPVFVFKTGRLSGMNFTFGLCIAAIMLAAVVRGYVTKKKSCSRPGSVADLVRRGQLRSDRRDSEPLKYEDPFNNPMVKVSKSNSTVEMCGKVYRLAPVSLTEETQTIHQRRRSRAYQWKRPTMFLKEGESAPPDVDPDTVRWIPANHPFATTCSDIDEGLAENNVYQKHGVPFRIQAEHEALQRKLEALQNVRWRLFVRENAITPTTLDTAVWPPTFKKEQNLSKLVIDPAAARDFERPVESHLKLDEHRSSSSKSDSNPSPTDRINNPFGSNSPSSEEMQNP